MNREQMIEQLVDQDIENIKTDMLSNDWSVVAYNLECGFIGYSNYTIGQLTAEIADREAMGQLFAEDAQIG